MYTRRLRRIAFFVGCILLIPLIGTFFVDGWNWGPFDFLAAGLMLFGTGVLIDLAARKIAHPFKKAIAIITIISVLLLMWVELAVDAVSRTLQSFQ